jgi:hypothetical protein
MAVTGTTKLEINSIVDRLVRPDGAIFDPDIARRLKHLLIVDCGLIQSNHPSMITSYPEEQRVEISHVSNNSIDCGKWELRLTAGKMNDLIDHTSTEVFCIRISNKISLLKRAAAAQEGYILFYDPDGEPMQLSQLRHEFRERRIKNLFFWALHQFGARETIAERYNVNSEGIFKRPADPQNAGQIKHDPH